MANEDWIGVFKDDVCVGAKAWPGGPTQKPVGDVDRQRRPPVSTGARKSGYHRRGRSGSGPGSPR